jgi:hypothetical protein
MQIIRAFHYGIAPTAIVGNNGIVYVPSNSGTLIALEQGGSVLRKHRISDALVGSIVPASKNTVIVAGMDGRVVMLRTGR